MEIFSNKYINESEALNNAIIGFEFEFYCDNSLYILLDRLNKSLKPIKVHVRRKYHSELEVDENNFKLEPDLSGGSELIELITGPITYTNSRIILMKVLKFLQYNCQTTDECSVHVNISFDEDKTDKIIDKIDPIKLILNVDEDYIYRLFPDRKHNFYAKSVKRVIPYKSFDYTPDAMNLLQQNVEISQDDRYYGINIKDVFVNRRLEFRYIGGKDYENKTKEISELVDYFILLSWKCINEPLNDDDKDKLQEYLTDNISNYKNFAMLENFIAEFPSIQLEIDKNDSFIIVKSYYGDFYDELYDLMMNIYNLNNCIINFNTDNKKLEIIDASFKVIFDLKNLTFVECNITNGNFTDCQFSNSELKNAHVYTSNFSSNDVMNCKLNFCEIDYACVVRNSFIYTSFVDGEVKSGVLRSIKLGPNAIISDKVKVVSDDKSYFGNKYDNTGGYGKKKSGSSKFPFMKDKDAKF